jgi:two-component system sensor histidine kinase VicK
MSAGLLSFSGDGLLQQMNPAAARLLDLDSELRDVAFDSIIDNTPTLAQIHALTSSETVEFSFHKKDNHLQIIVAPFGIEENERGFLVVAYDVTQQQKLDDMRREFVSNVSHELRTPLTNVRSYAETLHVTQDIDPETVRNFSQVIIGEADRMTRIVQDLLTLSKFDYHKMDWRISKVDFTTVLPSICQAMILEAQRREISLTCDIQNELPTLMCDRDRLSQVLFNILSNALTYTPAGGKVELSASSDNDHVYFQVSDTGIGIPQTDLPHVFDRFYRVEKARSRAQGGTGLGLSIAREIVQQHGGDIQISSEVNRGTTVVITLPIQIQIAQVQAPGDEE